MNNDENDKVPRSNKAMKKFIETPWEGVEWATDDDEILAHMEMLVRDYGAADDNSLTAGAKVLKRRVLVACAPLMNITAVLEAIREPIGVMVDAGYGYTDPADIWRAMIDALIAEVSDE